MRGDDRNTAGSGPFGRWTSELHVPVDGFMWISGDGWEFCDHERAAMSVAAEGPWLIPTRGVGSPTLTVEVLNNPQRLADPNVMRAGFHQRFARMADKSDRSRKVEILKFANRYGFLTQWPEKLLHMVSRTAINQGELIGAPGESYGQWLNAIFEMAAAVALLNHIWHEDIGSLAPLLHWYTPSEVAIRCVYRERRLWPYDDYYGDQWYDGAGRIQMRVRLHAFEDDPEMDGNAIAAARQVLSDLVTLRLDHGEVSPFVSWDPNDDLLFMPKSLLAALYLHLWRDLSGRTRLSVPCPHCGGFFTPGHGNQKYCSSQCKQKAYVRRTKWGSGG